MSGTNTYTSSGANSASTAGPSSESSVQPTILVHVLYTGDRAAELHEAFINSETQELKLAALVHEDMKALHLPRGTKHNISWTDGPTPFATMKWVFSTHEAAQAFMFKQVHKFPRGSFDGKRGITHFIISHHGFKPARPAQKAKAKASGQAKAIRNLPARPASVGDAGSSLTSQPSLKRPLRSNIPPLPAYKRTVRHPVHDMVHNIPCTYPQSEMEFVNKLLRDGLLLHQQLVDSEDYISLVLARQDSLDEYTVKLENFADAMVKRARDAERCMSTVRRDLVNNLSGNPSATPTEALASTSLQPESAREVVTRSMRKVREQCERTTKMLNDKLSEANADRDAAVVDTTHAVLDAAKLRTQLVDVMAQLERTQKELSAATVKASEAAKAKEELQITVSRLHDTRSQLSEAKLARDTAVAASKHVTSAANTSRAKLGDATSELTRIRTELSDAQGLVSEGAKAKEKLQRMGTALKDIRYQLSEAEAARDNAVATSVRVAADADELRTKLADAKAQLVRTRKELSDAAEKVLEAAKAKEKFQRMATLLKETQRQLSEAESVRNDAVATSNRAVSDADELRANLADAEATVSSMHHRISEVQASRDDAITSSKRAASDADDLRAQLAHLSDIESQLKRTQYQLSDAEAGRDSAVTISTRALSDVDDLRAQLSDAEAQLSKHSKNQEELSETARGLHVCLSDTKARLEATERELIEHVDYASKNAEEAEQAMDSLRMEIRDLQGQTEAEREHRLVKMEDDDTKLTGSATALIPFHTPPSVLAPVEDRREHQLIIIGLEQHLDDVQHRLRWAEGDLKQARDEATRLQLQLDTTHAGYRTVVEDCRLQVEQAREAAREAVEASALAVKELQSKEASRTPASDQVRVKCEECEETREQARVLQGSLTNAKALVIGREREEAPLLRSFEHLPAAILDVARMVARAASNSTSAPSSTSTSPFATR